MGYNDYTQREAHIPDEISNTFDAVLGGAQKYHHRNLLQEAEFSKFCAGIENIQTKLQAGLIGPAQALTMMQDLPFIEYVDDEGFGLDTLELDLSFRVNSHSEQKQNTDVKVGSETDASVSTGFLGMGAKVNQKVTAQVSHGAEQADSADYSAYMRVKATMKRTKAAPARRLTSLLVQEMVKDTHEMCKSVTKRQKQALQQEIAEQEVPKQLPKAEDAGNQGNSQETSSVDNFNQATATDADDAEN